MWASFSRLSVSRMAFDDEMSSIEILRNAAILLTTWSLIFSVFLILAMVRDDMPRCVLSADLVNPRAFKISFSFELFITIINPSYLKSFLIITKFTKKVKICQDFWSVSKDFWVDADASEQINTVKVKRNKTCGQGRN